ncbi:MAG: hypothetical protein BWX52_01989 [Bacteroidetes bacterium ADurb.Bin013]|nr:MAG: hypothetical protein BWX52_01989 [Bacteroidetes bacterium ADurb.Bin013]
MELCYTFMMRRQVKANKTFNYNSRGVSEQCRFYIIPLAADGVDFKFFPDLGKYFVFF